MFIRPFSFNKYAAFVLFSVFIHASLAQTLKGKIIDGDSRQPIPFAVVIVDNTNNGTTADLDGDFELVLPAGARQIKIQIIGYAKKTIALSELDIQKENIISLKSDGVSLLEIVVKPSENPAIPIIRQVIENKPKFDIDNLPFYFCDTYAKTYFTISNKKGDESDVEVDTAGMSRFGRELLTKSYLMFMESVTQKKYRYKGISQEKVVASRVSGFKSAPFGAFASQLQSFTFYTDNIELLGLKYLNPLSKGTFKRYNFEIADTVLNGTDTTLLINFYPKKNHKFKALKGVLYINKNQYVLANVLAEPSEIADDGTDVKIQQLYERVDSVHWFPKQLNTELLFNGISGSEKKDPNPSILKGVSRIYVRDIRLDSVIKIKNRSISSYNDIGFDKKDEAYWAQHRTDSLTAKEVMTYHLIDSVGKKLKLDKKLLWLNALTTKKLPLGYVNLDLKYILRVNDYEGTRLGAGLSTSDKLSRWISIGGYGGYGFKDKAWKYGGHAQLNLNRWQSTYFNLEAAREVVETAGTSFLEASNGFFSTERIRQLVVSKMDKLSFGKLSFNTSFFNFIKSSFYFAVQQRQSPYGYAEPKDNLLLNESKNFNFNEAGAQFKFWPKEKFTESMGQLVSLGSKWPIFYVNIAKGLTNNVYGYKGTFDYTKLDLRIDQQFNFKVKGFIAYQLQAGKVFGNVPYSLQYNNKSSRNDNYRVSVEKTFETMYMNEFISTQYAAIFLSINSGKFLTPNKYFNPEIELVHNYGIGKLDNRQNLTNIELNDISKGYSEAGIRLKSMYKTGVSSFGAGVFYRYGNYAIGSFEKNLTYKLVFSIALQ